MLIKVLHNNGSYDYVKPAILDSLIQQDKIISFYRKPGIAILGIHTIRSFPQAVTLVKSED